MRLILSTVLILFLSVGARADNVAREIVAYNNISVALSENADDCNLTNKAEFSERLREKLAAVGLALSQDSVVTVHLAISGNAFGLLDAQCASQVSLSFQTVLSAGNIVTDNSAIRMAIDRLGSFRILFYERGMSGVQFQSQPSAGGESTEARDAVFKMIDGLVERFVADRK